MWAWHSGPVLNLLADSDPFVVVAGFLKSQPALHERSPGLKIPSISFMKEKKNGNEESHICHLYFTHSLFIKKTEKGSFSFHLDASATKQDSA